MYIHPNTPSRSIRSRGTAEIELLLVIPVLLTMLFLIGAMLVLGPARIANIFQPASAAYQDAVASPAPTLAQPSNIQLDTASGATALFEENADRVHIAQNSTRVPFNMGLVKIPSITLSDHAEFISPAWAYSAWPDTADDSINEQWVDDYAAQSTAQWQDALGLQPAWRP